MLIKHLRHSTERMIQRDEERFTMAGGSVGRQETVVNTIPHIASEILDSARPLGRLVRVQHDSA